MREITTHKCSDLNESINIFAMDEFGPGGVSHRYRIVTVRRSSLRNKICPINFQNGAVKDVGVNGISDEALLAIVADRLDGFQCGEFACEDNDKALASVRCAIWRLSNRTEDRKKRGVEGHAKK